jgi:nucleotide-binding universal stress UspA family protein
MRRMFGKILVAVDGSEPSDHALNYALEISDKWSSELTIFVVVPRVMMPIFPDEGFGSAPITAYGDMGQYYDRMRSVYQNVLDEAVKQAKGRYPQVNVVPRLDEGRPSAAIVAAAEKDGVDLIVMGSRGIGGITGWILGSTSRRVVESCTRPILIVK